MILSYLDSFPKSLLIVFISIHLQICDKQRVSRQVFVPLKKKMYLHGRYFPHNFIEVNLHAIKFHMVGFRKKILKKTNNVSFIISPLYYDSCFHFSVCFSFVYFLRGRGQEGSHKYYSRNQSISKRFGVMTLVDKSEQMI